jgi:hypothetical protein
MATELYQWLLRASHYSWPPLRTEQPPEQPFLPHVQLGRAGALLVGSGELERQIEVVRTKLKFCEWQALPKEVEEQEQKLEKQRRELRILEGRPTTARVVTPRAGQLAWILPGGHSVARGQRIAELVTASQLSYLADERGRTVLPGTPATVHLAAGGSARVLLGRTEAGPRPGVGRIVVPLQLPAPYEISACSAELDMGQKRLLGWLFGS